MFVSEEGENEICLNIIRQFFMAVAGAGEDIYACLCIVLLAICLGISLSSFIERHKSSRSVQHVLEREETYAALLE